MSLVGGGGGEGGGEERFEDISLNYHSLNLKDRTQTTGIAFTARNVFHCQKPLFIICSSQS